MRARTLCLGLFTLSAIFAALFAACGGDDAGGSSSRTGPDEQYVKDLCKAADKLTTDMDKAFSGPTPDNIGDAFSSFFKAFSQPVQDFSKAFGKASAPADLKEWHQTTAKLLDDSAKALKAGKFDDPALDSLGDSPIANMPEGPRARLQAIAAKVPECKTNNIFEGP
ncbi:MAG: hypothetical protein ABI782_01225 [Anaerolineaceae bacterium]